MTPDGVFLISSSGISSDRGLGILGLPSLDFDLLPEGSRDLLMPSFRTAPLGLLLPGLSPDLESGEVPGRLSRRGVANPGPLPVLNSGRFSRDALEMARVW